MAPVPAGCLAHAALSSSPRGFARYARYGSLLSFAAAAAALFVVVVERRKERENRGRLAPRAAFWIGAVYCAPSGEEFHDRRKPHSAACKR